MKLKTKNYNKIYLLDLNFQLAIQVRAMIQIVDFLSVTKILCKVIKLAHQVGVKD